MDADFDKDINATPEGPDTEKKDGNFMRGVRNVFAGVALPLLAACSGSEKESNQVTNPVQDSTPKAERNEEPTQTETVPVAPPDIEQQSMEIDRRVGWEHAVVSVVFDENKDNQLSRIDVIGKKAGEYEIELHRTSQTHDVEYFKPDYTGVLVSRNKTEALAINAADILHEATVTPGSHVMFVSFTPESPSEENPTVKFRVQLGESPEPSAEVSIEPNRRISWEHAIVNVMYNEEEKHDLAKIDLIGLMKGRYDIELHPVSQNLGVEYIEPDYTGSLLVSDSTEALEIGASDILNDATLTPGSHVMVIKFTPEAALPSEPKAAEPAAKPEGTEVSPEETETPPEETGNPRAVPGVEIIDNMAKTATSSAVLEFRVRL